MKRFAKGFAVLVMLLTCLFNARISAMADEATLVLHWLPQAQFAGYYVALEKGFYADESIDLTILPGGADSVAGDRLSSGEAQFATMFLAAAIERRVAGIPIVNVAQVIQHSSLMILTRKSAGIDAIADLDGKRVAMWANDFQPQPWGLFKEHQVEVENIPFSGSMQLFLKGAVPATLAMWYNGYHTVLSAGFREEELRPFFFSDTRFDFPEDGIYCLQQTVEKQPKMVRKMVNASLKGWKYAFAHKDEAIEIVSRHIEKANLPVSTSHQLWMLNTMEKIMAARTAEENFGILGKKAFTAVVEIIDAAGLTHSLPSYEEFVWIGQHAD